MGAPAPLHAVRPHRLLRHLAGPARHRPLPRHRAPGDHELRARRGLVLGLHAPSPASSALELAPAAPAPRTRPSPARRPGARRLARRTSTSSALRPSVWVISRRTPSTTHPGQRPAHERQHRLDVAAVDVQDDRDVQHRRARRRPPRAGSGRRHPGACVRPTSTRVRVVEPARRAAARAGSGRCRTPGTRTTSTYTIRAPRRRAHGRKPPTSPYGVPGERREDLEAATDQPSRHVHRLRHPGPTRSPDASSVIVDTPGSPSQSSRPPLR